MNLISTAFLLGSICLVGCGDASNLALQVPDNLSQENKALVVDAWPKVKKACPGLDRYAKGIKFEGIQNNFNVDVVVSVPESGSGVPDRYMASGQTCSFGISQNGKTLSVAKEGCKALCLDRGITADEPLSRSDLKVEL